MIFFIIIIPKTPLGQFMFKLTSVKFFVCSCKQPKWKQMKTHEQGLPFSIVIQHLSRKKVESHHPARLCQYSCVLYHKIFSRSPLLGPLLPLLRTRKDHVIQQIRFLDYQAFRLTRVNFILYPDFSTKEWLNSSALWRLKLMNREKSAGVMGSQS